MYGRDGQHGLYPGLFLIRPDAGLIGSGNGAVIPGPFPFLPDPAVIVHRRTPDIVFHGAFQQRPVLHPHGQGQGAFEKYRLLHPGNQLSRRLRRSPLLQQALPEADRALPFRIPQRVIPLRLPAISPHRQLRPQPDRSTAAHSEPCPTGCAALRALCPAFSPFLRFRESAWPALYHLLYPPESGSQPHYYSTKETWQLNKGFTPCRRTVIMEAPDTRRKSLFYGGRCLYAVRYRGYKTGP